MKKQLRLMVAFLFALATGPLIAGAATGECYSLDGLSTAAVNPVETNGLIRKFNAPALRVTRSSTDQLQGTILLLPGGGYQLLDVVNEGSRTAARLNSFGYDVVMLEYHVDSGDQTRDLALQDALTSWRLLKTRSAALGVRGGRFGMMGYSAGGHLAARAVQTLANNSPDQQPDDLILIYPAYLDELAPDSSNPQVRPPKNPKPRLIAMIAADDKPAWVTGCWQYVDSWQKSGGQANYHVFKNGGHGFGMKPGLTGDVESWPEILKYFLENGTKPGVGPFNAVLPWFIGNRDERLADFKKHHARHQGSIVFLGDSITANCNLANFLPDSKVANRGIAGDTTRGMLCRLQSNVLDLHPKVIVLLGGINDLFQDPKGGPEAIGQNVRCMLQQIHAAAPNTPVLVCEIFPSQFIAADLVRAANATVAKVVADFPNARHIRTYEHFINSDGTQNSSLFGDGTHPNPAGYDVWKKNMKRELAHHGMGKPRL
jgi:lysophospholipase L1-like esterase/dienelactone hydrolase